MSISPNSGGERQFIALRAIRNFLSAIKKYRLTLFNRIVSWPRRLCHEAPYGGGREIGLRITKQRAKTLLLEVPVIGERFGQAFPAHRLHRNAIDQALTLVGPLA